MSCAQQPHDDNDENIFWLNRVLFKKHFGSASTSATREQAVFIAPHNTLQYSLYVIF